MELDEAVDALDLRDSLLDARFMEALSVLSDGADSSRRVPIATALYRLREVIGWLRAADEILENALVAACPWSDTHDADGTEDHTALHVPDVGKTIKVNGGKTPQRYDNDAIISELAARMADDFGGELDMETGEVVPVPTPVAIERTVRAMAKATGAAAPSFVAWRKTVAAGFGLDVKAHELERTDKRRTISFV